MASRLPSDMLQLKLQVDGCELGKENEDASSSPRRFGSRLRAGRSGPLKLSAASDSSAGSEPLGLGLRVPLAAPHSPNAAATPSPTRRKRRTLSGTVRPRDRPRCR